MTRASRIARKLVRAFGTTCQVERATDGDYDAEDGVGATATTTATTYACTDVLQNKQRGRVDGPVGTAEGVVYLEAGSGTIATTDVLIHGATRYSIVEATPHRIDATVIAWELFLRVGAA